MRRFAVVASLLLLVLAGCSSSDSSSDGTASGPSAKAPPFSAPCVTKNCIEFREAVASAASCYAAPGPLGCRNRLTTVSAKAQKVYDDPNFAWSDSTAKAIKQALKGAIDAKGDAARACNDNSKKKACVDAQDVAIEAFKRIDQGWVAASGAGPPPAPLPPVQSGTGDGVIEVDVARIAAVSVKYDGTGYFKLATDGSEPVLSEPGPYSGVAAIATNGIPVSKLRVTTEGAWSVQLIPLDAMERRTLPTSGTGDNVFVVIDGPGWVTGSCQDCSGSETAEIKFVTDGEPEPLGKLIQLKPEAMLMEGQGIVIVESKRSWTLGA